MDVCRRLMGVGLVVLSVVCPNVDASAQGQHGADGDEREDGDATG